MGGAGETNFPVFPFSHVVPAWEGTLPPNTRNMFLSFSPRWKDASRARRAITPVAATLKHVVDHPIGYAVVSGIFYADKWRKECGLPADFRGCVIISFAVNHLGQQFRTVYTTETL